MFGKNKRENIMLINNKNILVTRGTVDLKNQKEYVNNIRYKFIKDKEEYDKRYDINVTKLNHTLNWKVNESFDTEIVKTIESCLSKYEN